MGITMTMKEQEEVAIEWLLEHDEPGVRYLAMRDLLELPSDSVDLIAAQEVAHSQGPISEILDQMDDAGYWVNPGAGYHPKYRSTIWSVIILAQLGASTTVDKRIGRACQYLFENTITENGQFSITGRPAGTIGCLQGNLCAAMLDLGFRNPQLDKAFEWMARSITGEGVASAEDKQASMRYHSSSNCGPDFACGMNGKLPCAWGAVKSMWAFGKLSENERSDLIDSAMEKGVAFLLSVDPAEATYPAARGNGPSRNWWKLGFPVLYITDLLQNIEVLIRLGYGSDARLKNALNIIRDKQDRNGRWALEYAYTGKTWVDFGEKRKPNKWVTMRALRALKGTSSAG